MSEFVYKQMEESKNRLATLMEKGVVKNPALFWSGMMSTYIARLAMCSTFQLSDNIEMLVAIKVAYDEVIYEIN